MAQGVDFLRCRSIPGGQRGQRGVPRPGHVARIPVGVQASLWARGQVTPPDGVPCPRPGYIPGGDGSDLARAVGAEIVQCILRGGLARSAVQGLGAGVGVVAGVSLGLTGAVVCLGL